MDLQHFIYLYTRNTQICNGVKYRSKYHKSCSVLIYTSHYNKNLAQIFCLHGVHLLFLIFCRSQSQVLKFRKFWFVQCMSQGTKRLCLITEISVLLWLFSDYSQWTKCLQQCKTEYFSSLYMYILVPVFMFYWHVYKKGNCRTVIYSFKTLTWYCTMRATFSIISTPYLQRFGFKKWCLLLIPVRYKI